MRAQSFINLLNRLGHKRKTKWNVRIMERYAHGHGVATYLARYLRGGPITKRRLVSCDGREVSFAYRDNHDRPEGGKGATSLMRLPIEAFIQRLLLHVPAPNTQVVRYYGVYQSSKSEALGVCRGHLGQGPVDVPEHLDWQTVCGQHAGEHAERCPRCGRLLVCTAIFHRGGVPPPGLGVGVAA